MHAHVDAQTTADSNPPHISPQQFRRPAGELATPATPAAVATPYFVGNCNTFHMPLGASPLSSWVSQRLLESLNLVLMDKGGGELTGDSPRLPGFCSHHRNVQYSGIPLCHPVNCS